MLTTLYCDASFCPHRLVGGWGIWARSDQGRIVESGVAPDYCVDSNHAELAAIYAGIYRVTTRWPQTEAILVRSDCQTALTWMRKSKRSQLRPEGAKRLLGKIEKAQHESPHDLRLIPRWVKGHRRGVKVDIWLNNKVDELARQVMEAERVRVGNRETPT